MTTTAIIMADLAEDLASQGLDVGVVCAQATYLINEVSPKSEHHNGVGIKRVWTFLFNKFKNIGRILNSTSCFLSMFPKLFHGNIHVLPNWADQNRIYPVPHGMVGFGEGLLAI
jgi:hypothetical protein